MTSTAGVIGRQLEQEWFSEGEHNSLDIGRVEKEGEKLALDYVINNLQRPDQLEKLDQLKQRVTRKKASVDAMLKTAMQNQFEDMRHGLSKLQLALDSMDQLRTGLQEIDTQLKSVLDFSDKFDDIRAESRLHQQYDTIVRTMGFKHTVDRVVERSQRSIEQGSLLVTHKYLIELERTRDRLLCDLVLKLGDNTDVVERLKAQFRQVDVLSEQLGKQLWLKLSRVLAIVRSQPQQIVTVFRIIWREEQADRDAMVALDGYSSSVTPLAASYVPSSRPKRWKQKAFSILEESVYTRIEANVFSSREDSAMWLVQHLEICRMVILDDLKTVKYHLAPACPPSYDIFNFYVTLYHSALSKHLIDTIIPVIVGNEYYTLLSWIGQVYTSSHLLRHPSLAINVTEMAPLLDTKTVAKLMDEYLQSIESNFEEWLLKAIAKESADWQRDVLPDEENGCYQTTLSCIVIQMLDQNLQLAKSISDSFVMRVLLVSYDQIIRFCDRYSEVIRSYKQQHFRDRSQIKYFTHYMIANINNCSVFPSMTKEMNERYWTPSVGSSVPSTSKALETVFTQFQKLEAEFVEFLLEEIVLDLESHFRDLLSRSWLHSDECVNTICATLEDYCSDYVHLRAQPLRHALVSLVRLVFVKYFGAVFHRRITFKTSEERVLCADKMVSDGKQLYMTVERFLVASSLEDVMPLTLLNALAEVIKVSDGDPLTIEVYALQRASPEISAEQLTALLMLRGDLGRLEVRQRVQEVITAAAERRRAQEAERPVSMETGEARTTPVINLVGVPVQTALFSIS